MDIAKIAQFIWYTPETSKHPDDIFEDILRSERLSYLQKEDIGPLRKAYAFAKKYHTGQKRLSWEPYIIHPLKVLNFLTYIKPWIASMQTALLHDLIEDTEVTKEIIQNEFWEDVANLCEWLVKVSKIRYKWEDRQLETLKKTFLAMGKDLRVIIIKIADRVHNIQTLHFHPSTQKKTRIAEETLKIYVPIAKRLWLYVYQGLLENGAFYQLRPKEYQRIYEYVIKEYWNVDLYKNTWIQNLEYLCQSEELSFHRILWRLKSPYRIYKKLLKYQTQDISKIMDILAFRIITDSIANCYSILWIIHKHYTPIFAKMKDYISIPKPNWYKSLHTTVLWMFDFPVEIQVRTQEMDYVANYWVAAHFAYSDHWAPIEVSDSQARWIQKLQGIVNKYSEATDKESFKHELDIEILQKNIFVYTPKWDIIEMPLWSTLLDFAFRVHTDIGLKFKNWFINWKIVPLDYKLKTWDIVKIDTFKNKYSATKSRTQSLHTPTAKSKLQRFLRTQEKDQILAKIESVLNKKLETYKLPLIGSKEDRLKKTYKTQDDYENILFKVRDKQISPTKLIKDLYWDMMPKIDQEVIQKKQETISTLTKKWEKEVLVEGNRFLKTSYCPECKPRFPQKIIAKTWKGWLKIHRTKCKALETIDHKKLLEVHRKGQAANVYTLKLELEVSDKPWSLLQILRILDYYGINVQYVNATPASGTENNKSTVELHLEFNNPSKMWFLINDFKQRKKLIKIITSNLS